MIIGICGPITVNQLKDYLDIKSFPSNEYPHGIGSSAVTQLVEGLLEDGQRICVFTLDQEVKNEVILSGEYLHIFIGPYRPRARFRAVDFFRVERNYLTKAIRREKPDIIHAHWTYEFALGALASGVPTVMTVRDWAPYVLKSFRNAYRLVRFAMDWRSFSKSEYIIANSPYIADKVKKRWKKDATIIPNSIENDLILRSRKSTFTESPVIVSINNGMDKRKNVEILIRAFSIITKSFTKCRLMLIGSGFEPGGVAERWADDNGLNEGIEYAGVITREQIIIALDKSMLLVHPSLEESFGNTLVEAMARGVPVIGGKDSGAVPWVLDNGRAGVLCDVSDPYSVAAAALQLLSSRQIWSSFSAAGLHRAQEFRLSNILSHTMSHYEYILSRSKKSLGSRVL